MEIIQSIRQGSVALLLGIVVQLQGRAVKLCTEAFLHRQRIGKGNGVRTKHKVFAGGVDHDAVMCTAVVVRVRFCAGLFQHIELAGESCTCRSFGFAPGCGVGVGLKRFFRVGSPFRVGDLDLVANDDRLDFCYISCTDIMLL